MAASSLFFAFLMTPHALQAQELLLDRVVAVVNQEAITQSELDIIFRPIHAQLTEAYQGAELVMEIEKTRQKLLNQLIEDRLVLQQARKLGIEVSESEVDDKIEQFKTEMGGERAFQAALDKQGFTIESIRKRFRDQILMKKLHYVEVHRKVVVSPLEISEFYDEHPELFNETEKIKVWSITFPKNDTAIRKGIMDEQAKAKTYAVLKRLKTGEDFETVARQESLDSHSQEGGLMGYVYRGDMIGSIDTVLFQMKNGEITDILQTERGYHIFKVDNKQPSKTLILEEARPRIREILYQKKVNIRFEEWMERLKRDAFISLR